MKKNSQDITAFCGTIKGKGKQCNHLEVSNMFIFWVGNSALLIACEHNKVAVVRLLLKNNKINVNIKNNNNKTGLNISCYFYHTKIISLLLQHKNINVNIKKTCDQCYFFFNHGEKIFPPIFLMVEKKTAKISRNKLDVPGNAVNFCFFVCSF